MKNKTREVLTIVLGIFGSGAMLYKLNEDQVLQSHNVHPFATLAILTLIASGFAFAILGGALLYLGKIRKYRDLNKPDKAQRNLVLNVFLVPFYAAGSYLVITEGSSALRIIWSILLVTLALHAVWSYGVVRRQRRRSA